MTSSPKSIGSSNPYNMVRATLDAQLKALQADNAHKLEQMRAAARAGGGERRVEGQHAKGKLTAKGRQQAHATREAVKRARKAAQIARRNPQQFAAR